MDCPNGIRECPNGWTDCSLCANLEMCKAGLYYGESGETDHEILEEAAKVSGRVMQAEAVESAEKIKKGNPAKPYTNLSKFYAFKTPDLHYREPLPAGDRIPGGGGKNRCKKSKKGTKIPIDPWTSNV